MITNMSRLPRTKRGRLFSVLVSVEIDVLRVRLLRVP